MTSASLLFLVILNILLIILSTIYIIYIYQTCYNKFENIYYFIKNLINNLLYIIYKNILLSSTENFLKKIIITRYYKKIIIQNIAKSIFSMIRVSLLDF